MKPSHIIAALIGLAFVVELLADSEDGVLSNLQENSRTMAAADEAPSPSTMPVPKTAPTTRANPWSIDEDSTAFEADNLAEPDTSEAGTSENRHAAIETMPVNSQRQPGSPEFPHVALPKPRLTAAGPQIHYPQVLMR